MKSSRSKKDLLLAKTYEGKNLTKSELEYISKNYKLIDLLTNQQSNERSVSSKKPDIRLRPTQTNKQAARSMRRISGNLDHHKFQGFQNNGDCIRIISVDPEERPNQ